MKDQLLIFYDWAFDFLMIVGLFRLIFKPIFALINHFIVLSETKKDDLIVSEFRSKRWVIFVMALLDWLFSIKLRKR